MSLTVDRTFQRSNGSEWCRGNWPNDPMEAPTLWDFRHVALENEFANAANAWISAKQETHQWLTLSREAHRTFKCAVWYLEKEREGDAISEVRMRSELLRAEFEALAKQWSRDTRHLSHISKKITHHAFLRIIGMGEAAIPLILEALRQKPAHWFTALRATANTDPAKPEDTPSQAREAWIAWGISKGYID